MSNQEEKSDTLCVLAKKLEHRNSLAREYYDMRLAQSPRFPFVRMQLAIACKQVTNLVGQVNWKESKHADAD